MFFASPDVLSLGKTESPERALPNGVFEPEGAWTSPLNSVSNSNMCPTQNRHFFTYQIIFLSLSVLGSISVSLPVYFRPFFSLFLPFSFS